MSLNDTPRAGRVHIGIFGRRNAGKSSLINAITSQNIAIVSEVKGTTTDPVYKSMELLPLGPVTIIDTPGPDDQGTLGQQRVQKTQQVLAKTDIAILVIDAREGRTDLEEDLIATFQKQKIPYLIVWNKVDLLESPQQLKLGPLELAVSAATKEGTEELKERLARLVPQEEADCQLIGDLLSPNDVVVLVVPIDSAAPKGRLILPQQQPIGDILDSSAIAIVTKETELKEALQSVSKRPRLVVTDSQAFAQVSKDTPVDIPLTSFSILFARYKGDLTQLVQGAKAVENLQDGDKVLISEGCTHHRQCDDIGTVKIPRWLTQYTGKNLVFETTSGTEFPSDLKKYALVVHCGGCMLNRREMKHRIQVAAENGIPIVNYGVLIAYLQGILKRTLMPFPQAYELLQ